MAAVKEEVPVAALIGDVVGSRRAADRADLHHRLDELVARANGELQPLVPLRITVGDEYQACFETVGEALHAAIWLRLNLLPDIDVRHGVGWGPVELLDRDPRVEDGPGWWAAREAIEWAKAEAARPSLRHLRTVYRRHASAKGPGAEGVNAALVCRDQMVGSMSQRSLRLLQGGFEGRSQAMLAEEEGVSASAVSQRFRNDGLAAVLAAEELLRRVT